MGKQRQVGSASIFAVIFASILLSVITVSFMRLMLREQTQSINNDLSQSAYDAAMAGVEDAKRVIRACQQGDTTACIALNSDACDALFSLSAIGGVSGLTERVIQTNNSGAGRSFSQAYTCLKVSMYSEDFVYYGQENKPQIIPLKAESNFDTIVVEWFSRNNLAADTGAAALVAAPAGSINDLPKKSDWKNGSNVNVPSLIRAQLITPGANFNVTSLDNSDTSKTAFLRPTSVTTGVPTDQEKDMTTAVRVNNNVNARTDLTGVICAQKITVAREYSCKIELKVGNISKADSANALLVLNHLYRSSNVRVSLKNGNSVVRLDGGQPTVDSTGRANNLFRRVEARLQVGDDIWYPSFAADIVNNICKDFSITDTQAIAGVCDPNQNN